MMMTENLNMKHIDDFSQTRELANLLYEDRKKYNLYETIECNKKEKKSKASKNITNSLELVQF